jgi:hypothetical protein
MLMDACCCNVNNLELASRGFLGKDERAFCIINPLVSEGF